MDKQKIQAMISVLKTLHVSDFESMDKLVSVVYLLIAELKKQEGGEENGR